MTQNNPKDVERFKEWIVARGGELLVNTCEWEAVRFRADGLTSIIYTNQKGRFTFTGVSHAAWTAFEKKREDFRLQVRAGGRRPTGNERSVIVRTILERDGNVCFFCGTPFTEEQPPTREHLVPVTSGGPDHISNLFLAHGPCNGKAGHLSAPEKIRMRDRMRRGVGSKLLARAYDRMVGGEGDPPLFEEITAFLHESKPKEKTANG